jgi:ketosteroid isomerase-like protein
MADFARIQPVNMKGSTVNDKQSKEKDELRMMSMLLEAEQSEKESLAQRLFGGDGFGWMILLVALALIAAGSVMVVRAFAPHMLGAQSNAEQHVQVVAKPPQAEPAKVEQAPKVEMQAIVVEETQEQKEKKIILALETWAKAWSAKDLDKYFAAYSPNFEPPKGQQRKEWEADRKARISSKSAIKVQIKDIAVKWDDKKAIVTLTQSYQADEINATGKKVFDMVQESDQWLILREANQ